MIETLEAANATEDPARREELLTYVFVGGGYAGLEALAELQDFAADAIESYPRARLHGMRWVLVEADRPGPARDRRRARRLRPARAARPRHRHPPRHHAGGGRAPTAPGIATGETLPTRTVVWTAGVAPHPSLRQLSLPLDERGRVPVDEHLRVKGIGLGLGDRRLRRGTRPARRPLPADRAARRPPGPGRRPQHRRRARASAAPQPFDYRGNAAFVNLGRYKAVGRVGGRTFRGFPAWWMARTYHMSQIPGAARKARAVIDWTASLPFRRDLSEVGSIGHPKPLEATMGPWDSSTSSSPSSSA